MSYYCKICGEENCKKHSFPIGKSKSIKEFSGSSPPEIFVGKWNYPNVYTGILAPQEYGSTEILSSPELWHQQNLQIPEILSFRNRLIYGRTQSNVKKPYSKKFLPIMQEVAMTHKSIATEFKLKKPISFHKESESSVPLIKNAAEINSVSLQENPKVKEKVNYLVNDTDVKSREAILELAKSGIENSSITKILSAGLLGLKKNRKLVPTRWSITAVDDLLSKEKLKNIKFFQEISDYRVFHSYYLGNNYHFLLLPDKFSFEVLEISMQSFKVWKDYESYRGRKSYAESVTGAYYANRLALTEYLEKIKRQASCIVFREIRAEYYAPLGVGILRQTSRKAFESPQIFQTLNESLNKIRENLRININQFTSNSKILKEFGKQTKLSKFLN